MEYQMKIADRLGQNLPRLRVLVDGPQDPSR